jgi:hypothetical protein
VVGTPGRRPAALAAVAVALAVAAAGCSSGSAPRGPARRQSLFAARSADSGALLAQCALRHDVDGLLASARQASTALPASQRWLHGRAILLTKDSAAPFDAWFQAHAAGVVVQGRRLDNWEEYAGSHGKLPAAVCGSGISARQLHDQIYAQFPSAKKKDPWGT